MRVDPSGRGAIVAGWAGNLSQQGVFRTCWSRRGRFAGIWVMLKKVVGGVVIAAILGCLVGIVVGNPFVYVASFDVLLGGILFAMWMLVMKLVGRMLPKNLEDGYKRKRDRLTVIIFFAALHYFCFRPVLNVIVLPRAPGVISLLDTIATIVFVVFLGWCTIGIIKIRSIVLGSVLFVLFTASLSFINATADESGETTGSSQLEKLGSLGYADWVPAEEVAQRGVTHYDPELAFSGMNLYASRSLQEANLIDMQGNVVHRWAGKEPGKGDWQHVEMCKNGDLLVVAKNRMLIRLDWDSKVKWQRKMRAHHDVAVDEDGTIYALSRENRLVFWHGIPLPILSDCVVVLSPDGEIKKKIYIDDLVKEQFTLRTILKEYKPIMDADFDIMHTNSIEIVDRNIEGFCKKGDWLISMRNLDFVGVVDAKKKESVWSWGPGELEEQHQPALLKNGNVLIFDNRPGKKSSRIVELNPLTRKIEWEYESDPPEEVFSRRRGGSQRLPNGNTLITETNRGRVFEITREGKVVWEFYNPDTNTKNKKRAAIYRLSRISNSAVSGFLKK